MYEIPTSIEINNHSYPIRNKGDYRMVLDCLTTLEDEKLTKQERVIASLIIFYEGMNEIGDLEQLGDLEIATKEMYKFFNCGEEDSPGAHTNYKLVDWKGDAQLISSAINKVANKEIREVPYIHWWTFMGYYLAVGESALSTVVGIRSKLARGKKLEKYELEFKRDNPHYFNWNSRTIEQKEADELVRQIWNSEG